MPTVFVTAPPDAAPELARTLVEERLAACVNRVPCDSVYRWDGRVHEESEEILLAKTTEDGYAALRDRVEELHPYDVPCIERFDDADALPAFASWVERSTGEGSPDGDS
ncbi:divalent cation tolerance protein [Halopelagius inordinatus]|uniref:Divalent cation tolerance protein n=1 Tax=Halopelagius inordinatus TaxID=553467 RepID=A0A1I2PP59_9EURY|nr:divalent-cation tolerance protein CutA [Halopelagius inordinatus]SFG17922.1 divalent cation tolerance protein [Halopelagius inordinatus]